MANVATGVNSGKQIAEALGIKHEHLRRVTLKIAYDDIVTIKAEYIAEEEDVANGLSYITSKYKLEEIDHDKSTI